MAMNWNSSGISDGLTTEFIRRYVQCLSQCYYVETAASLAGVPVTKIRAWLKKGHREPGTIYADFLYEVEHALATVESDHVRALEALSKKEWKVAAWLLERRFPERWGDQRKKIKELEILVRQLMEQVGHGQSSRFAVEPSQDGDASECDRDD